LTEEEKNKLKRGEDVDSIPTTDVEEYFGAATKSKVDIEENIVEKIKSE
jgi:hypothetical protein